LAIFDNRRSHMHRSYFLIICLLLSTVGCTEEAVLEFVPYATVAGAIVLVFLLKTLSTGKPDTPSSGTGPEFDLVKQKELHEKSPAYKEHLAQLDAFRIKDPAFDADTFLKWVDNDIVEYVHKVYSFDPDVYHEMLKEYRSLPPEKKAEADRYNSMGAHLPLEYLRPYCTEEMIQLLEKELGSECGRITRRVIHFDGGDVFPTQSKVHAALQGDGALCGRTYRWSVRGDRFTITKILQEAGMDRIVVHEQREVSERKYDNVGMGSNPKDLDDLEILRLLLEECDYTFSRPSGSGTWRLSSKGTKLVTERREGMHKEGYTLPE